MTLPTKTDLLVMQYAFQGQPFVDVPAKDSITLTAMEYAFQAQPFVRNPAGAAVNTTNFFLMF